MMDVPEIIKGLYAQVKCEGHDHSLVPCAFCFAPACPDGMKAIKDDMVCATCWRNAHDAVGDTRNLRRLLAQPSNVRGRLGPILAAYHLGAKAIHANQSVRNLARSLAALKVLLDRIHPELSELVEDEHMRILGFSPKTPHAADIVDKPILDVLENRKPRPEILKKRIVDLVTRVAGHANDLHFFNQKQWQDLRRSTGEHALLTVAFGNTTRDLLDRGLFVLLVQLASSCDLAAQMVRNYVHFVPASMADSGHYGRDPERG